MDILRADFYTGAAEEKHFPNHHMPEIAFVGRSNVGKSSLLNSICRRKELAKTSATPGKTQQINFFTVDAKFVLVDLPGFGYAKVSKDMRRDFEKLNKAYLFGRENLVLTIVLVDIRHDPSPIDLSLIEELENAQRRYVVVLTKSDKVSKTFVREREEQLRELTSLCQSCVDILPYSSVEGGGRPQLLGIIRKACLAE